MERDLRTIGVAVVCAALLTGCAWHDRENGGAPPAGTETKDDQSHQAPVMPEQSVLEELPDRFRGTAGIVSEPSEARAPVTLETVRTLARPYFDRVIFTFSGEKLPGYHLEYIDQPVRRCGSGQVVPLEGQGWLLVRLEPARAHTQQGEPTVESRHRQPDLPLLREMALTCDFEGQVAWVLGLVAPNRYRVMEMADPARLVVDIRR